MRDLYDIHCHILTGVDDGAKNMDIALALIEKEIEAGVETIILTPHFRKEMFEPDMEDIWNAYDELLYETRYKNIRLYLGCEFHANMEMVETLDNDLRPTLADSRYVLTEFAHNSTRAFMKERADALLMSGYRPIIAHIERYRATRKDFDLIEDLIEMGCEVQVNADAIIGRDGLGAQRFCKKLMQEDMLHYVGSDTHNLRGRAPHLGECCEYLKKHMGRLYTNRCRRDNPSKIVEKAR